MEVSGDHEELAIESANTESPTAISASGQLPIPNTESRITEQDWLSEDDLEILVAFQRQLAEAKPEDFAIAEETSLAEVERPAEISGEAAILIEQVGEQLENMSTLEPAAIAEAHVLLEEVTADLEAIEDLLFEMEFESETAPNTAEALAAENNPLEAETDNTFEALANIESESAKTEDKTEALAQAEEKLVQHLQKLCETIGLDYSEDHIKSIVKQLLAERQQIIHRDPTQRMADGAESQISVQKGTHEALRWFLLTVKQLKIQTNWIHRFLGQYAIGINRNQQLQITE